MDTLQVGAPAPQLGSFARSHGRPRVVAFARAWRGDDLDQLRAPLRALGAELIVLAAAGVWTLSGDDASEQTYSDRLDANIATIALCFGVHRCDALFIVDAGDTIRFARRYDIPMSLADALIDATEIVLAPAQEPLTLTRRGWVASMAAAGAAVAIGCRTRDEAHAVDHDGLASGELEIALAVNGQTHTLTIDPRASLLDTLRERLGLTGTKKGCDMGQCGACTVHLGGRRVLSCLTLAALAQGQPITTIEGLARKGELHPMQRAFIEHDALQCGFCTPGQIMSATAIETDGDIREHMSGNICRCGAYPNIVAAIRAVQKGS